MAKVIKEDVRQLATRKCDSFGNYEIYLEGGGNIPAKLGGIYTGQTLAETSLENYRTEQGIINQAKKLKEEIKSITPLDHEYDGV